MKDENGNNVCDSKDLEAVWSDNPEKTYFKHHMEDNAMGRVEDGKDMDDSIIGADTIANLMEDGRFKQQANGGFLDCSFLHAREPPRPSELAIVGIEDDLSTIANSTVGGSVIELSKPHPIFIGAPRPRDFREFYTPEKNKYPGHEDESLDETLPETPPGMIRVPGKDSSQLTQLKWKEAGRIQGLEDNNNDSFFFANLKKTKRTLVLASVLGIILLASIGALSIALLKVRQDQSPQVSPASDANSPLSNFTFPPISLTIPPAVAPSQTVVVAPSSLTTAPTPVPPVAVQTPAPVLPPTQLPTAIATQPPVMAARQYLLGLLENASQQSSTMLQDTSSIQYEAFNWLANDPTFSNYTDTRLIQRWALTVFYLYLSPIRPAGPSGIRRELGPLPLPSPALAKWATFADTCTWAGLTCDPQGLVNSIDLQGSNLSATLPSEIWLLSNSLGK